MTKKESRARSRKRQSAPVLRRLALSWVMALIAAVQIPGCGVLPFEEQNTSPAADAPAAPGGDFKECLQHFPAGNVPRIAWPGRQRALCFDSFAVLHSGESKTAVYSVERLTRANVLAAKAIKRTEHFYPEARLPFTHRAQLADYGRSGYDRGHMAPAGDMPTDVAKAQSFSLANMVPQAPELNQRTWSQIEKATRQYVLRAPSDVFVFTGPAFDQRPDTIGPGHVWVPSHTWKVVYTIGENRAWAYWMPNKSGEQSLKPISYEDFERLSRLTLLAQWSLHRQNL